MTTSSSKTMLFVALILLMGCSDTTFSVNNSAPGAAILSPEDGYITSLGEEISFRGQVTDRATAATDLTVVWSSSRDGTLNEEGADSSGLTQFLYSELSEGSHSITLRVVDGDGSSGTDQVQITIGSIGDDDDSSTGDDDDSSTGDDDDSSTGDDDDSSIGDDDDDTSTGDDDDTSTGDDDDSTPPASNAPPGAPGVSISPNSPSASDALVCSISIASIDPENDPVSYDFAFTVGGNPTSHTLSGGTHNSTLSVPSASTSSGQQWTCTVTPHDGFQSGSSGSDMVTVTGACTDLNGDCYPDIVFSNSWDGNVDWELDSYVYWGGASGYSASQRQALPTLGSKGNLIIDLDNDGYEDIVFANERDNTSYYVDSYIYWGSASGYSVSNRTGLPTMGARAVDAGDIDRDGFLDLVFANTYEGSGYIIDSYIYYGSASGFSMANYDGITTIGAHDVKLADLDADGWLDLAVATFRNEGQYLLDSYIFWGSSNGFSVANRTDLPTMGASSVDTGDLDGDGILDLVFSNAYNSTTNEYAINSYIYWGSATAPHYSDTDRMELPTLGTWGVTVDDVNDDGDLDIVFANRFEYSSGYAINSFLYRGDPGGANGIYSLLNRDVIATQGAWANDVEDLNGDGYRDIVFANRRGGTPNTTFVDSYIYWGSASGFSTSNRTELPTIGASDVSIGGQ